MSPSGKRCRTDATSCDSDDDASMLVGGKRSKNKSFVVEPINQQLALEYICPITKELPVDPVIASDGRVYERLAIEEHIRRQKCTRNRRAANESHDIKSPMSNISIGDQVYEAIQVRNTIQHLIDTKTISEDLIYSWKRNKAVWEAKRNADMGDTAAMIDLATWYYYGVRGLQKDEGKAYEWYQKAALVCTNAMVSLSKCFLLDGKSEFYNQSLGVYYLSQAAEKGNASACLMLGSAFLREEHGLPKDNRLAGKWLRMAESNDSVTDGVKMMARLFLGKLE